MTSNMTPERFARLFIEALIRAAATIVVLDEMKKVQGRKASGDE